ncbi:MAG TPA: dihydrofolate reductase [Xanthobacteraceae bacterium]|nr:dihydrofolate reductase [Xanthobacteraceae bacterium]
MRRIEGYVIVSADGMLADGKGEMPASIRNKADQRFFQDALDHAAVVVHGRHSHEGGPHAARRKRLVLTRQIAATAPDPSHPNALLWNPVGATLDQALEQLGVIEGIIAVIGGPEVFSLFLPLYDAFHLSRVANVTIPGGIPPFTEVGRNATPEDVLERHGFKAGPRRDLDAAAGVSVVTWQR